MTLRVVGAGLGRTGTLSLKIALERLLGGRCYHMIEVFSNPEHIGLWHDAARGNRPDWDALLDGYVACVDWPSVSFWRELSAAHPEALILHSMRTDAPTWWQSADETSLVHTRRQRDSGENNPWLAMFQELCRARFAADFDDGNAWMAAYDKHNAEVRAEAPADRYLAWQPGDGWAPICAALGVDVPDEPFPHVNTREEWARM